MTEDDVTVQHRVTRTTTITTTEKKERKYLSISFFLFPVRIQTRKR